MNATQYLEENNALYLMDYYVEVSIIMDDDMEDSNGEVKEWVINSLSILIKDGMVNNTNFIIDSEAILCQYESYKSWLIKSKMLEEMKRNYAKKIAAKSIK